MKGDACGFLHEMIPERMPECQTFLKKGYCPDPDCPFKHTRENIKECNMYALGFCIFGPECRYNHTRKPGPPPDPSSVEAAKPKMFRDINRVVNAVNQDVAGENEGAGPAKRQRCVQPSLIQTHVLVPWFCGLVSQLSEAVQRLSLNTTKEFRSSCLSEPCHRAGLMAPWSLRNCPGSDRLPV
jgi:hypothetical protein